jgi:hypothetical protein
MEGFRLEVMATMGCVAMVVELGWWLEFGFEGKLLWGCVGV